LYASDLPVTTAVDQFEPGLPRNRRHRSPWPLSVLSRVAVPARRCGGSWAIIRAVSRTRQPRPDRGHPTVAVSVPAPPPPGPPPDPGRVTSSPPHRRHRPRRPDARGRCTGLSRLDRITGQRGQRGRHRGGACCTMRSAGRGRRHSAPGCASPRVKALIRGRDAVTGTDRGGTRARTWPWIGAALAVFAAA
jgi:hypothetical protein